jgi:lipopolysaccharide/colanic/teichoic acid biosynthesis glycosyltransferase
VADITKKSHELGQLYDCVREDRLYEMAKRVIDLVVASTCLVLFSPLWLLVAGLVKLTSPGPALFRGSVAGLRGELFTYYKFRTMVAGDDSHHRRWLREFVIDDAAYSGDLFKVVKDPRVTLMGRWLRRYSVDEVPQFLNVLKGEMSVVGPRPPIRFEFDLYDDAAKRRLAVKPGITGLYQVTGRSQLPFSKMLAVDLEYIQRRSLLLDFEIMLRTVSSMISGRGAG